MSRNWNGRLAEREGKLTLRTYKVKTKSLEPATGQKIQAIRKRLKKS